MFFLSAVRTNSRKVALQAPDFYLLLAKQPCPSADGAIYVQI
jgi:hypothetical protein